MLVLTNNQTTATLLKKQQLADSAVDITATSIYTLEQWIKNYWQQLIDAADPLVGSDTWLSPIQVKALWAEVVEEFSEAIIGQNRSQWSDLSYQAWQLLINGDISSEQLSHFEQEGINFSQWLRRFEELLQKNNYYTQQHIPQRLINYFQNSDYCPQPIILVGVFQPMAALRQRLLVAASGNNIEVRALVTQQSKVNQLALKQATIVQELEYAISWALRQSHGNISVVVPSITQQLPQIKRVVNKLSPSNIAIGGATKLADTTEYSTVKLLLQWLHKGLNFNASLQLFRSNLWAIASNIGIQAGIESLMYNSRINNPFQDPYRVVSALDCYNFINRYLNIKDSEHLLQKIKSAIDTARSKPQIPSQWLAIFLDWLRLLEIKHSDKMLWNTAIALLQQQFLQMDSVIKKCPSSQAIDWFNKIAQTPIPRALQGKTITIVDTVEGAINADMVWLCSADNQHWPSPINRHPLIASQLLQRANSARSSSQLEIEHCHHLLQLLENNCQQVIYSYCTDVNQPDLTISPLLSNRDIEPLSDVAIDRSFLQPALTTNLEWLDDNSVEPLSQLEKNDSRGGAGLIKTMAHCLYSTFIKYRLKAEPLDAPTMGISPLMRGNLVHHAMELLWDRVKTQQQLKKYSTLELERCCDDIIATAIDQLNQYNQYSELLLKVERQRLKGLITKWLDIELQRPEFTVLGVEQPLAINLAELDLKLKVDRIDQNEQGQLLIIDYKTGSQLSPSAWLQFRAGSKKEYDYEALTPPKEPQLPLYILALADDPAPSPTEAIAFVQLNTQHQKIIGISSQGNFELEGIKAVDWQAAKRYWQASINAIIIKYSAGDISINQRQVDASYLPLIRGLQQ